MIALKVCFWEKRVFSFLLTSSAPAEAGGADGESGALTQGGEELDDSRIGYRYSGVVYPWEKEGKRADGGEAFEGFDEYGGNWMIGIPYVRLR